MSDSAERVAAYERLRNDPKRQELAERVQRQTAECQRCRWYGPEGHVHPTPSAESVAARNDEQWRQKILAEMGVTYRALSAGPADWRALEASFTILSRYSWAARQGYVCPTTWPPDPVLNDGCQEGS